MTALGAALSLAALGVGAFLAIYVFGVRPRGSANRAFLVLMLAFMIWDASEAVVRYLPRPETPDEAVVPLLKAVWVGIVLVPAALMHLSLVYPEPSPALRRGWTLPLVYAPFVGYVVVIAGTNLAWDGVAENWFGPNARATTTWAFFAWPFGLWLYAGVGMFVRAWWRARKGSTGPMQRAVVAGLLVGSIPAGVTEIFWPSFGWDETPLGLGSLYTLTWSIFIAYAVARYHYLVIEPVTEARPVRGAKHALERGVNHLVLEPGRSTAMGAFREIVSTTPGLCITGIAPSRIVTRFGLERTPILWITGASSEGRVVRPSALEFELLHSVLKFLRENPGTAVLLDDLDYLAELDGFDAVARFVRRVTNQASASGGTAILAVGTSTFSADQVAVLQGVVDDVLEIVHGPGDVAVPNGDHVLLLVPSQEAPGALVAAGSRGGLLLTMEHPAKARRRFGEAYEVLWIAEGGEPDGPRVPPGSLDLEAKRAVAHYVHGHPGADVVLVGLEQLGLYNDFRTLLGFVKDALDLASLAGSRIFITVGPAAMSPREVAMLARRFDAPVAPEGVRKALPSGPSTASPESRILYRGPVS